MAPDFVPASRAFGSGIHAAAAYFLQAGGSGAAARPRGCPGPLRGLWNLRDASPAPPVRGAGHEGEPQRPRPADARRAPPGVRPSDGRPGGGGAVPCAAGRPGHGRGAGPGHRGGGPAGAGRRATAGRRRPQRPLRVLAQSDQSPAPGDRCARLASTYGSTSTGGRRCASRDGVRRLSPNGRGPKASLFDDCTDHPHTISDGVRSLPQDGRGFLLDLLLCFPLRHAAWPAARSARASAARADFVRRRRIAIAATTSSWTVLDGGGRGVGSSWASVRSASSRRPIRRRRRTSRCRAYTAFARSPCASSVARAASSALAAQPRSREARAMSASATAHLARATASLAPKARAARRSSVFARTRSPSCAIAMPRSASAGASSRRATRFSAPRDHRGRGRAPPP